MKKNTYGVIDLDGTHTDISKSLHATKIYATKHNFANISVRYNSGYIVNIIYTKIKNKWFKI